jgi:triphosphoribosyl-dephospho-CoA synthase
LARIPDINRADASTHGSQVRLKYGFGGARSEAQAGFPHVVEVGLPALRNSRSCGHSEAHARLDALLAIIATLADTCLLHRGGTASLMAAQLGAAHVLELGGSATAEGGRALLNLHETLMCLWASPGGSADLLAATLFLDLLSTATGKSA